MVRGQALTEKIGSNHISEGKLYSDCNPPEKVKGSPKKTPSQKVPKTAAIIPEMRVVA
jgi:hypothetical protein